MTERAADGARLAFYVDTTRCINCRTCEVACKDANGAGPGVRHPPRPGVRGRHLSRRSTPTTSPCRAITARIRLASRSARPGLTPESGGRAGHPRSRPAASAAGIAPGPAHTARRNTIREAGQVVKCNMCLGKTAEGEPPACVAACPMRAIEVASFEEIAARAGATDAIRDLPPPSFTRPRSRYKVRPEAEPGNEEG